MLYRQRRGRNSHLYARHKVSQPALLSAHRPCHLCVSVAEEPLNGGCCKRKKERREREGKKRKKGRKEKEKEQTSKQESSLQGKNGTENTNSGERNYNRATTVSQYFLNHDKNQRTSCGPGPRRSVSPSILRRLQGNIAWLLCLPRQMALGSGPNWATFCD